MSLPRSPAESTVEPARVGRVDAVLAAVGGALDDGDVSVDAMRWSPEPRPAMPERAAARRCGIPGCPGE